MNQESFLPPAAALHERFAKRAVLEQQVNANLEGMGYGL